MGTLSSPDTDKTSIAWVGRRKAILAAGAAVIGVVATTFGGRRVAEAHGTLHVDSATTDPAIHGANSSDGPGVLGTSQDGPGVRGDSVTFIGVRGASDQFIGV